MVIIYNWPGLGIALISIAAGYGFDALLVPRLNLTGVNRVDSVLLVAGLVSIAADVVYRWKNHYLSEWWLVHPRMGGQIFFIPSWIIGILVCFGRPISDWFAARQ